MSHTRLRETTPGAAILLAVAALAVGAVEVRISGTVVGVDGNGIEGAIVHLVKAPVSATTNAAGEFELTAVATSAGHSARAGQPGRNPVLRRDRLILPVGSSKEKVSISLLTHSGRTIRSLNLTLPQGTHEIALSKLVPAGISNGGVLITVRVDGRETVLRSSVLTGAAAATGESGPGSLTGLAKRVAVDDTIVARKGGYATARLALKSYTVQGVVLELARSEGPSGEPVLSYGYTLTGNTLRYDYGDMEYAYCEGDSLVRTTYREMMEGQGYDDAYRYAVSADTLTLELSHRYPDSSAEALAEALAGDTAPGEGSITFEYSYTYSRLGEGNDIRDMWLAEGATMEIMVEGFTPDVNDAIRELFGGVGWDMSSMCQLSEMYMEFTDDSVRAYTDMSGADMFIGMWNGAFFGDSSLADSADYDVTVTRINDSTVQLTGNVTGEVVTITYSRIYIDSDGFQTYTSSNPDHAPHTFYNNPPSCPNEYEPAWYRDFLYGNAKGGGTAKKRAQRAWRVFDRGALPLRHFMR